MNLGVLDPVDDSGDFLFRFNSFKIIGFFGRLAIMVTHRFRERVGKLKEEGNVLMNTSGINVSKNECPMKYT